MTTTSELADSLAQDEIPIKLRCASCNKLVLNAFRLPCCDQNICENCQSELPEACPVCMHSPLSADDCKPNKALRLTVKAFLKNEEKKRDKQEVIAPTPASSISQPGVVTANGVSEVPSIKGDSVLPSVEVDPAPVPSGVVESQAAARPSASPVPETKTNKSTSEPPADSADHATAPELSETALDGGSHIEDAPAMNVNEEVKEHGQYGTWEKSKEQSLQATNMGFGFDGANTNASQQQGWNGAFNPMLNMQAGWQGFPTMMGMPGVPGMGMDAMMMSQMFGGFNGQGMGVNGMNGMNMGMGFDGNYGGWNEPNAMGMGGMNGGFGANAGYYPSSGYNQPSHQGHYNQMQQPQYPLHNSNQNRFRGHVQSQKGFDRGDMAYHAGRGRGQAQRQMYNFVPHANGDQTFNRQIPVDVQAQQTSLQIEPQAETKIETGEQIGEQEQQEQTIEDPAADDETLKDTDAKVAGDNDYAEDSSSSIDFNLGNEEEADEQHDIEYQGGGEDQQQQPVEHWNEYESGPDRTYSAEETLLQPIATVETFDAPPMDTQMSYLNGMSVAPLGPAVPLGPAAHFSPQVMPEFLGRGRGNMRGFRGGHRGRGMGRMGGFDFAATDMITPPPVQPIGQGVVGAPTGPKALREGRPNVGFRGRGGFPSAGRGVLVAPVAPAAATAAIMTNGMPLPAQESPPQDQQRSHSPTPTRSRSASHQRSHHHRSPSVAEENDEDNYGESRSKKRRRSHRHDEPDEVVETECSHHKRSRDASRESKHRSHRSDREKDRHQSSRSERDRSYERRKRRHRSRSPAEEPALDEIKAAATNSKEVHSTSSSRHRSSRHEFSGYRDRDRGRDHDRDRKRSRRHKSASPIERDVQRDSRPSSRRDSVVQAKAGPESPSVGPKSIQPPTGPREFRIKGARRESVSKPPAFTSELEHQKAIVRKEKPDIDPHTLEREARNRERLLKEQQRRESLIGSAGTTKGGSGRKRSADNGAMNGNGERRSKRKTREEKVVGRKGRGSWQYEDELRAERVENEREAARWA